MEMYMSFKRFALRSRIDAWIDPGILVILVSAPGPFGLIWFLN